MVKLHITDNAEELLSFVVQLSGCQGEISSIHLASNGLYVAVPQFPLTFLDRNTELDKFIETVQALRTMKQHVERLADLLPIGYVKWTDFCDHLSRAKVKDGNSMLEWTRPTWYTPPGEAPYVASKNLYPPKTAQGFIYKLLEAKRHDEGGDQLQQKHLETG